MDNLIYVLFVAIFVPILLMTCLVEKKARHPLVFVLIGIFVSVFAAEVNGVMVDLLPLSTFEITIIVTPISEEILKAIPILFFASILSPKKRSGFHRGYGDWYRICRFGKRILYVERCIV